MKEHRIRLTDEEIKMIAEALEKVGSPLQWRFKWMTEAARRKETRRST